MKIEWKSKIIDLLIVIIGITVAFQLNNWNEYNKSNEKARSYLASFSEENKRNEYDLMKELDFLVDNKDNIDTLLSLLIAKEYNNKKMNLYVSSLMLLANFNPSITTMGNIKASGEFDLIKDIEIRKQLINTYDSYLLTTMFDQIVVDYTNDYITPYFFANVRFTEMMSTELKFLEDPSLENIVVGYVTLTNQQTDGYKESLKQVKLLNEYLAQSLK